jgi:hypothetical protein
VLTGGHCFSFRLIKQLIRQMLSGDKVYDVIWNFLCVFCLPEVIGIDVITQGIDAPSGKRPAIC